MAVILISYPELADLINTSGKLPTMIEKISSENCSLYVHLKIAAVIPVIKVRIALKECNYPYLFITIDGIAVKTVMKLANKLLAPKKIADGIHFLENGSVKIDMEKIAQKNGFAVESINVENVSNQLKIEIMNFRKISVDR